MRMVPLKEPWSDEVQVKIEALLPKTSPQFKYLSIGGLPLSISGAGG